MTDIILKVVAEAFVNGRDIMDTGSAMLGLGGDNAFCGGCGRELMHEVPVRSMVVDLLYRCDQCGALNEVPKNN